MTESPSSPAPTDPTMPVPPPPSDPLAFPTLGETSGTEGTDTAPTEVVPVTPAVDLPAPVAPAEAAATPASPASPPADQTTAYPTTPPPYPSTPPSLQGGPTAYSTGAPVTPPYQPHPPTMSPDQERSVAMIAHGGTLAATILSGGALGFVCALVMYLVFKDRGPFARNHTANALNVQIVWSLVMLVSLPLMLLLVGFITYPAAVIAVIVLHVIGLLRASNGEFWNPPMTPALVR